jgi:hypothetical protein
VSLGQRRLQGHSPLIVLDRFAEGTHQVLRIAEIIVGDGIARILLNRQRKAGARLLSPFQS